MGISFVGVSDIEKLLKNPNVVFIDLRDVCEYKKVHIKGAVSIPYEKFAEKIGALSKRKIYVLYCERGATSIMAASIMLKKGFRCYSLSGGIEAFRE